MKILVINAGSSSLKYQLIDMEHETLLAKGICEQIGDANATFTHKVPDCPEKTIKSEPHLMADHSEAIQLVLNTLVDAEHGVIKSMDEIGAVGHRVLHGAEKFSASVLVTEEMKETVKECFKFGPLHNPANLKGIEACEKIMNVPQVAVFDTGFHQTMPDYAYMYALPYELYEKDGIRKYGFHGTSHRYVSGRCIELLGGKAEGTKIVTCHLGNGSSISAVKDGKCFDTTMGLTPLEGIMMGTRSGDIDGGAITFIQKKLGLDADGISNLLNKKSGVFGLCGYSDMRDVENAVKEGEPKAVMAEESYFYRIKKYIGAYAAAMGGIDVLVFTAGVGENQASMREGTCEGLEFMGIKIDKELNATIHGKEAIISTPDSKVKVVVIPTDEELMIAKDTMELVQK